MMIEKKLRSRISRPEFLFGILVSYEREGSYRS